MAELEYPKRPKFYAYRLTRLMFKTALANDIGPEACHLIIQIAHTEDAARYARPVTFYNEQLLPVCGFANVKSLDRARAKAVKSGWLVYMPGGKGKAGRYWTVIPDQYIEQDDTSIDESNSVTELQPSEGVATYLPVAGNETPDKRETSGKETGDKRERNARETPDKRATIQPIPNPYPEYKELTTAEIANVEKADEPFVPVEAFSRDLAISGIEIGGRLVEYFEEPLAWEAEFVRLWNGLPGVHPRNDDLDGPLRSALQQRLCERRWFWKRAFAEFPLQTDMPFTQNLSWFLKRGTVSSILDGTYHQPERQTKTKGKKHDRPLTNAGQVYDPNTARPGGIGW